MDMDGSSRCPRFKGWGMLTLLCIHICKHTVQGQAAIPFQVISKALGCIFHRRLKADSLISDPTKASNILPQTKTLVMSIRHLGDSLISDPTKALNILPQIRTLVPRSIRHLVDSPISDTIKALNVLNRHSPQTKASLFLVPRPITPMVDSHTTVVPNILSSPFPQTMTLRFPKGMHK
jgi:hypothetical protein